MLISSSLSNDDYENDDLIKFQIDSKTINLYYSQLTKYSKVVREKYLFSDVINKLLQDIHNFQKEYQLSTENMIYFFQLLSQNYNIEKQVNLSYIQCIELLKISKFMKTRKLSKQINDYIKDHNIDTDFLIQMIQYEISIQKQQQQIKNTKIEINAELENLISNKVNECLLNEKFSKLPITIIYRIIESSKKSIDNNKLFDFIKKSIHEFCVLFSFLEIEELSTERLEELCELYTISDESERKYFNYMKCNLYLIKRMIENKKMQDTKIDETEKKNNKQLHDMNELEIQIKQLQEQLKETVKEKELQQQKIQEITTQNSLLQNELAKSEEANNQIQAQLKKSTEEKIQLQKRLDEENFSIKGQIIARVKSGLLINAQINLKTKRTSIDSSRSKYIISTSNEKTLGMNAYKKGEAITSLQMNTIDFVCKAGTYFVRCLVFDNEGNSTEIVSNSVTTNGTSASFSYEGDATKISLHQGRYKLEVWGAKGGDSTQKRNNSEISKGGLGGYSSGILKLNENETVYIYVGGEGRSSNLPDGSSTKGGFPDGGDTKTGHCYNSTTVPGTGGGSTSIRIGGFTDSSRVIVAGGGGGASGSSCNTNHGGFGGGFIGGRSQSNNSSKNLGSGTQTGSTGGHGCGIHGCSGKFGKGADAPYQSNGDSGGGGGGGWYGGGSGGTGSSGGSGSSSGGGGSGWTFTESSFNSWRSGDPSNSSNFLLGSSYYLSDAVSIGGDNEFPRPDGNGQERGHAGNGYAKITPL